MKISKTLLMIAALSAVLLIASGPGHKFGAWDYGTGFLLMRIAFFGGIGSAVIALIMLLVPKTRQSGAGALAASLVIGLATAWVPWNGLQTARSLPMIHDITTDMENPPQFVDVVPLRADAPNPVNYAGEDIAVQQREAYPELQPLEFSQSADVIYEQALAVSMNMGWEIVADAAGEGRIEATDTTRWFGFKDDIVIRIVPTASGSRLDIRSKSRVGRSDVGKNAARIREFVDALQKSQG